MALGVAACQHLLASFLAVTMLPAAALFWLSWRSLEQDRLIEAERVRKRCEQAADLLVAALQQKLSAAELRLPSFDPSADDAAVLVFGKADVHARPAGRILYYPAGCRSAGCYSQPERRSNSARATSPAPPRFFGTSQTCRSRHPGCRVASARVAGALPATFLVIG